MSSPVVILGAPSDAHVHLGLVNVDAVAASVLGRVVDLGGELHAARAVQVHDGRPPLRIEIAGPLVTPAGGYPSTRGWAQPGWWREVSDERAAARVVAEVADAGATRLKIASNSVAGPVFPDDLLAALVALAERRALPVVVHAEGPGEADRALTAGAGFLAHAPFSELLSRVQIAAHAARVTWISTLGIHPPGSADRARAIENVAAFHAAGGRVLYGTDKGNGEQSVGLDPAELDALREAGLTTSDLLFALDLADPRDPSARLMAVDGEGDELDLATARPALRKDLP